MNAVAELPQQKQSLVQKFAGRYSVDPTKLLPTLKATAFKVDAGQVSDEQMMALLIVADQYGLNPFTKEVFAFPDKHKGIVPVVSVDGWARIINDNGMLDGIEFVYGPQKGSHHEWIECVIYRKDRAKPIRVREFWEEVARSTGPWQSHGNRMHRHKALIQCSRIAFGFAGIYDEDEAERIIERDVTPQVQQPVAFPRGKQQASEPARKEPIVVEQAPQTDSAPAQEPPGTEQQSTESDGGEVTPENALKPGQVKVIQAKLAHAALTDLDFKAKFGKPLVDEGGFPNFQASQANELLAWINERAGG